MGELRFRDPYADLAFSQLLAPSEAVKLSRAERAVLTAAVRSEILTNHEIRQVLKTKVQSVLGELKSSRRHLPLME